MKDKIYDVAIIGAGIVGSMCAFHLSKYKLNIAVLEAGIDVASGTTRANSAIIHAGYDANEGSLKAKLNVKGSLMVEPIAKQLGVHYKRCGSLVIGFNEQDLDHLNRLLVRGKKNGVLGLEIIDEKRLHQMEPNVSKEAKYALYAPTAGIVCPYDLAYATCENACTNGADFFFEYKVDKIEKVGLSFSLYAKEKCVRAKYVVNCAGLYADEIAGLISEKLPFEIIPRRGEYMLLDKECGSLVSHTIFRCPSKMGKGILVSPTVDGNLLLGPTATDIEDKEDKSVTAEGYAQIISRAGDNVSGIPFGKVITSFCGLRAVGSTGDFIIKLRDGVLTLGGIESPGLTSAPAIAEYVEELLRDSGVEMIEKSDYEPRRRPSHAFNNMTLEEKNEVIKRDPRYGRIVCRCEGITEGEIVDAIHTNPGARDVDGIKRRTRSGMGRCQGGFCSPIVVQIIARELGIPFEEVTKFGKGSTINYGKTKGDK